MEIIITSRNMDLSNTLKRYVRKRLSKVKRLYKRIYRCEVILEEEKIRKNVEVVIHLKRNRIVAKESSLDVFTSIDETVDKVKTQLRRLNDRVLSVRKQRKEVRRQKTVDF
ncbi:MAG: ribosome-associated translation inhibitor RaiA [Candidatus Omnitrophota bacterium]